MVFEDYCLILLSGWEYLDADTDFQTFYSKVTAERMT